MEYYKMDVVSSDAPSNSSAAIVSENSYQVYKRRWFLLATLAVLNLSNALAWLSFGPVAYKAAQFYNTDLDTINWLSVVFMISGIPCGIVATWLIDTIGLRFSVILSAWLNAAGCIIRAISAVSGILTSAKLPLVFLGQSIAAIAQPFMLFAPTKLAAYWFKDDQRALANILATIANPLGIMLCNILSPILLPQPSSMFFMLAIESIPALVAVVMATLGWWSSKPPTPPSVSANEESESFIVGVKLLLRSWRYWLLAVTVGAGIALFSVLTTILSQTLCPWGYDDIFVGVVCGSAMVGAGFVGSGIAGVLVDKTKRFTAVTKVGFAVAVCALVGFAVLQNRPGQYVAIAFMCGIFGFFGIPVYPVGNELAVETTYPVGEATSSGIVFMFGQLQGIILVLLLQSIGREIPKDEQTYAKCASKNLGDIPVIDMSIPVYVMTAYAGVIGIIYILFFRTKYHRLNAEMGESPQQTPTEPNFTIGKEIKNSLVDKDLE